MNVRRKKGWRPRKADWPHWATPTRRAWKAQKRREARALERAVWKLLIGASMTPIRDIGQMLTTVREYRKQLSVKEWGR